MRVLERTRQPGTTALVTSQQGKVARDRVLIGSEVVLDPSLAERYGSFWLVSGQVTPYQAGKKTEGKGRERRARLGCAVLCCAVLRYAFRFPDVGTCVPRWLVHFVISFFFPFVLLPFFASPSTVINCFRTILQ